MNPRPVVPPKYLKNRIGFKVIGRLGHIRLFEKLINSNKYLQQTTLLVPHPQMGYRKRSRNRYGNFMFYQNPVRYHDRIHITYLPLSTKLKNALIHAGIDTRGDLLDYLNQAGKEGLLILSGVARKGLEEIETVVLKNPDSILPPRWTRTPTSKTNRLLKFEIIFDPQDGWNSFAGLQDDTKSIMSMLVISLRNAFGEQITIQEELGGVTVGAISHIEIGLTIPVDPVLDRAPIRKTKLDYNTQVIFERNEITTLADLALLFSEDLSKTRDQLLDLQGMNEQKVDQLLHLIPLGTNRQKSLLALCR